MASAVINIEDFTLITSIQDRIETLHGISVHTIDSLAGCSALCLIKGNCWSLFYNFVTQVCRLNKSPFLAVSETTGQAGFHHYSREYCKGPIPAIPGTTQTFSFVNGIPAVTFACITGAIYISGNKEMTCELGTLQWNTATVVCRDLAPYTALGYTEVCGTESVLKFVGNKVNFDAAKGNCAGGGGHLARPRNTVRWTCLKDYAYTKGVGVHVWMDITDRAQEGVLAFSDNTLVPLPYHWLPGEPLAATKHSADCVAIWPNHRQWDDLPCGNVAFFICEIEL
ncbi:uncharacterized protein LOC117340368 [Pecten maximus]|uniref:uncharacterized protein LOC117340368 n=1 Tax=Pecten maximus TaxID=6579 RepID=UPI00145850D7|nr:uncharacterized protein LOC117340368 [Pecten maximus]